MVQNDEIKKILNSDSIGIVIPAFNEGSNLKILIPHILKVLKSIDKLSRILIVNDGSTDETTLVVKNIISTTDSLEVLNLRRNSGKSIALQLGISKLLAMGGVTKIIMMDADGQDNPAEIVNLLRHLDENGGLVTGARIIRNDNFMKRITS